MVKIVSYKPIETVQLKIKEKTLLTVRRVSKLSKGKDLIYKTIIEKRS